MASYAYSYIAITFCSFSLMVRTSGITKATKGGSESLIAEAKALMGSGWWSNHSKESVDHCRWPGVSCNAAGSVFEIDLGGYGLIGSITPQIGALSKVEFLNLSWNNLTGELPPSLGNFTRLSVLDISRNKIESIPMAIQNMRNLVSRNLARNSIVHMPSAIGPSFPELVKAHSTSWEHTWRDSFAKRELRSELTVIEATIRVGRHRLKQTNPGTIVEYDLEIEARARRIHTQTLRERRRQRSNPESESNSADLAKEWLFYLLPNSITTWAQMTRLFLDRFFHVVKMIDVASGGALVNMTPTEARDLISTIAANSEQFRTNKEPPRRVHEINCCPLIQDDTATQVNAVENFPGPPQRAYNLYDNTYNLGWRDHPNFSYAQNSRSNQGYQARSPPPQQQAHKTSLESIVERLTLSHEKFQIRIEAHL
ncbi:hypothetical protein F3Y22_tig00111244pilonHSYRG00030 [Hibiscus syriacus]|uniref:Leucine-rich repeat-containing N-terminal plant-type domain-containing protein n=1 Tax=Hibiscus syriacus TaxID=106335 RepID=A0A6A2YSR9_HIBSY|nr:hypothetical protein F3Y22_tig00111244pilonHSYRG00030 [Hibiscus syriacus]